MSLPTEHAHDCPQRLAPPMVAPCTCGLAARIDAAQPDHEPWCDEHPESVRKLAGFRTFPAMCTCTDKGPMTRQHAEEIARRRRVALERTHHLAENWRRIAGRLLRAAFGDDANFGHVPPTELVDGEIAEQVTRTLRSYARTEMVKLALKNAEEPTHQPYRVTNTPMHYVVQGPLVDLGIDFSEPLPGETRNFENEVIERAFNAAYRAGWISGREVGRNEPGAQLGTPAYRNRITLIAAEPLTPGQMVTLDGKGRAIAAGYGSPASIGIALAPGADHLGVLVEVAMADQLYEPQTVTGTTQNDITFRLIGENNDD